IKVAAKLNGLEINPAPDFQMGVTNQTDEYKAKFTTGKVPAFEGADGLTLFDSDAIFQYVAESGPASAQLLGSTPAERAKIRQWIMFAAELASPMVAKVLPYLGMPYDAKLDEKFTPTIDRYLGILDSYLEGKTYLASEKTFSAADLAVLSILTNGFLTFIDAEARAQRKNIMEWVNRLLAIDVIKEAYTYEGVQWAEKKRQLE
ncbi:hypothetical protein KEM55_006022, partial [Ascosphaera atra]